MQEVNPITVQFATSVSRLLDITRPAIAVHPDAERFCYIDKYGVLILKDDEPCMKIAYEISYALCYSTYYFTKYTLDERLKETFCHGFAMAVYFLFRERIVRPRSISDEMMTLALGFAADIILTDKRFIAYRASFMDRTLIRQRRPVMNSDVIKAAREAAPYAKKLAKELNIPIDSLKKKSKRKNKRGQ